LNRSIHGVFPKKNLYVADDNRTWRDRRTNVDGSMHMTNICVSYTN